MTGPRPPGSEHLDLDALADVLAAERSDDPHLPHCASCRQRLSELEQAQERVAAALAALPEPALPDGLERRLAAALRDPRGPGPTSSEPGDGAGSPGRRAASRRTLPPPLRQRSRRAWVPAAAASLVLVLGGGLGYALVSSGSGAGDASTSAAGGATESQSGQDTARTEAAAPSPADEQSAGALAVPAPPRSATGADYADEQQRAAALPRVLAGPDRAERRGSAGPLARLRDPAALAACLSAVTAGSGVAPLAVDEGLLSGAPALAVVLPSRAAAEVVVHVVGPDCAADDADTLLVVPVARP